MDREQIAWAAGLFDGEGHTRFKKAPNNQACVEITIGQKTPEVLYKFMDAMGGLGRVRGPYGRESSGLCPMYQYACTKFEHAQQVIAYMWEFLSVPKKQQMVNAMEKIVAHRRSKRGLPRLL